MTHGEQQLAAGSMSAMASFAKLHAADLEAPVKRQRYQRRSPSLAPQHLLLPSGTDAHLCKTSKGAAASAVVAYGKTKCGPALRAGRFWLGKCPDCIISAWPLSRRTHECKSAEFSGAGWRGVLQHRDSGHTRVAGMALAQLTTSGCDLWRPSRRRP